MITTNLTGNLGNHMWQYAVCRMIAEHKGYDWGINSTPSHDYFNGKSQMEFMEIDYGKPVDGIVNSFHEKWLHIQHVDVVNIAMLDERIYNIEDNTVLLGDNGAYGGLFQCEDYLIDRKSDVEQWFSIKPEYKKQYEILLGQFKSGNTSPLIKNKLKQYVVESMETGALTRREAWQILFELANA
jgi:hypothetical protein